MQEPKNQDPVAWARFNESQSTLELSLSRAITRQNRDEARANREIRSFAVEVRVMPDSLKDLIIVVRNAASELENGGERENRIGQQLLTALAAFAQETGT